MKSAGRFPGQLYTRSFDITPDGEAFLVKINFIQPNVATGAYAATCSNGMLRTTNPQIGELAYSESQHALLAGGQPFTPDPNNGASDCDLYLGNWRALRQNSRIAFTDTIYVAVRAGSIPGKYKVTRSYDVPEHAEIPVGTWTATCGANSLLFDREGGSGGGALTYTFGLSGNDTVSWDGMNFGSDGQNIYPNLPPNLTVADKRSTPEGWIQGVWRVKCNDVSTTIAVFGFDHKTGYYDTGPVNWEISGNRLTISLQGNGWIKSGIYKKIGENSFSFTADGHSPKVFERCAT